MLFMGACTRFLNYSLRLEKPRIIHVNNADTSEISVKNAEMSRSWSELRIIHVANADSIKSMFTTRIWQGIGVGNVEMDSYM